MDGYRFIHGVAPIVPTVEDGKRYSIVYYSKKELFEFYCYNSLKFANA